MAEKQWNVRSLDMYFPDKKTNLAASLGDLLTLRGVAVRLVGRARAGSFAVASGRQHALSFIIDPQSVLSTTVGGARPAPGRYFAYATEEVPRKGSSAYAAFIAGGWDTFFKGALCVYLTFPQILEGRDEGCITRVLPPPPVAFPTCSAVTSDVVFCGVPDERQGKVLSLLRRKTHIRCTQCASGAELTSQLAKARVVVMPCAEGARLLQVCEMSEIMLSGAIVVAEAPPLAAPRVYDERAIYVRPRDDLDELAKDFGTAITAAMLGRKAATSRGELLRVETALLHVTQGALEGLGRPGPLPAFLAGVREWMGAPSIHAGVRTLCEDPSSWRALETRTLIDLARSIPPLHTEAGERVMTVCLYSGDPDSCMASVRAVTAAFPQHSHAVVCPADDVPAVAEALSAVGAPHVRVIGSAPGAWRDTVRTPGFWVGIESEFALLYSDALLLRSARLEDFMDHDLVQYRASADAHVCIVRVSALVRALQSGPVAQDEGFIPTAGLHNPGGSSAAAKMSAALFPSDVSVVPGPAVVRPPGVRIGLVDSVGGTEGAPGEWSASLVMGLLTILGSQLTVFSAIPAAKWVNAVLDAWGKNRQLHGLACLPHTASELIAQDEFDLLIDVAGARGPTVRARRSRVQWLVYCGDLSVAPAWWRPRAMRSVFDRVCLGCVAHLSHAQHIQGGSTEGLALLPSPSYAPEPPPPKPSGMRSRYACVVRGSKGGRRVARAFERAALGATKRLTILLQSDDPAVVAEIQAVAGARTKVVVAMDARTRGSVLSDARHAILVQESGDDGGMPAEVLEAIRHGCVPLWSTGSAAAGVLSSGVHGSEFEDEADLIRVLHAADAGALFQTKEGAEDCVGMVSLHAPVVLRQALMSVLLGGRGLLDTGLLQVDPSVETAEGSAVEGQEAGVPAPHPEDTDIDSVYSMPFAAPVEALPRAPPRPPVRARAPVMRRRRRFALGL